MTFRKSWRGEFTCDISDMLGLTFTEVTKVDDEKLVFNLENGGSFRLFHDQDCCERVEIVDIVGSLQDLVGTPLLLAEEVTSKDKQPWESEEDIRYRDFSYTWTFYKFATVKGYVDVRWLGQSNGYYSEEVDLEYQGPLPESAILEKK